MHLRPKALESALNRCSNRRNGMICQLSDFWLFCEGNYRGVSYVIKFSGVGAAKKSQKYLSDSFFFHRQQNKMVFNFV